VLNRSLVVARKEIRDHARDRRALASAALSALMGPAVVLIVLIATGPASAEAKGRSWVTMAAVFALMSGFTGAMSVTTDLIAGERERRSLLPLLVSAPSSLAVVVGKWLAATAFAAAGLAITVVAFVLVFGVFGMPLPGAFTVVSIAPAVLALAPLAAALELYVSIACRSAKEAHTYLSMLTFIVMGAAMWLAFRPQTMTGWGAVLPVAGHQRLLEQGLGGGPASIAQGVTMVVISAALTATTMIATLMVLAAARQAFTLDEAVYGG
jgi:sodium transport system permease protein